MGKGRLEAFSDGVIAILITIMVLEMHPPSSGGAAALKPLLPIFVSYVLSFVYIGIYWNNHHHMLHASSRVNGAILWANLHLLFWLSLVPFTTAWMGSNRFSSSSVALYGVVLLMAGVAYYALSRALISHHGSASPLAQAVGRDFKGILSVVLYAAAIGLSFVSRWSALALYVAVAVMWVIPDRRIENVLREETA